MKKLVIVGGKRLNGNIKISGSKNATLPILAASILNQNKLVIENIPLVKDVETMVELLSLLGSDIKCIKKSRTIQITNSKKIGTFAPYKLLKTMRAGILVLGPLLAKYKKAKVSLPGGCAIGLRPVDIHLNALKKLGVNFLIKDGYIYGEAKKGLIGTKIRFPKISVGATENLLIASSFAKGTTVLTNCACEPEIKDLTNFLIKMGCKIKWISKRKVQIIGVKNLKPAKHKVMFDRIEACTYLIASAVTNGKIKIEKINPKIIKNEILTLKKMGIKIITRKNYLLVSNNKKPKSIKIKTNPFPGFPTDLQAQIMVLMCNSQGISQI